MFRAFVVCAAVIELLAPRRLVAWGERMAFENPDEGRLGPWTIPMARLEGVLFVWLALTGRLTSPAVGRLLGVVGAFAFLAPRRLLEAGLGVAYENPAELEVKPWVVPFTRVLGVGYVVLALFVGRVDAPEGEGLEE